MRHVSTGLLLFVLLVTAAVAGARSTESPLPDPHELPYRIPLLQGEVSADGVLDESVWSDALVMKLEYEVRPGENVPPPVETEVLLAYGESDLFVAFKAYDPNPGEIRARMRDRDEIGSDDWVAINLDTFNDARQSFLLMCNPFGVQSDFTEVTGGGGSEWDTIWDSGGRIHDWGYAVEMVIPFSSLRFQRSAEDQIWGVDAIRSYPRNVRHHIGLFPRDRDNNCYLCQATKIVGFAGADPGRSIEIDPTISGIVAQQREDSDYGPFDDGDHDLNAGFTARWGITPNITLASTYNPDFSQIESDVFQLDVNTRWALFYPERRPFFLEGNDFFSSHDRLVYTRTVADPIWGAKITGKEGANGIGVFVAQDEYTSMLFPSSEGSEIESLERNSMTGVVRYKRDVGESSYIGATVTDRESMNDPNGEHYGNRVGSLDATIDINQNNRLKLQLMNSWTEYPANIQENYEQDASISGEGTRAVYIHDTRSWDSWAYSVRRHPDFRADAGFINMTDAATYGSGTDYTFYSDADNWYSSIGIGSEAEVTSTYDHSRPLERQINGYLWGNGPMQSWVNFWGEFERTWYEGDEYITDSMWLSGGFFPHPNLYTDLGFGLGKDIDYSNNRPGVFWEIESEIQWLAGRNLRIDLSHTYNQLETRPGRLYAANISRIRCVYQFNRRMFVRAIVQNVHYDFNKSVYDDPDDVDDVYQRIASQLLFSYTVNPQTVIYIGYSDNIRAYDNNPLAQTDRVFFFKLGYAWVL